MLWNIGLMVALIVVIVYAGYRARGVQAGLWAGAVSIVGAAVNTSGMYYAWTHMNKGAPPLRDIAHIALGSTSDHSEWPNILLAILGTILAWALITSKDVWRHTSRMFFVFSCLNTVRGVLLFTTIYPYLRGVEHCGDLPKSVLDTFLRALSGSTCADYVMSGHTSTAILFTTWIYILFDENKSSFWNMISVYLASVLLIGVMFTLLYFRWHYTIDIYVGAITALAVMRVYAVVEQTEPDAFCFFGRKRRKLPN